MFFKSHGEVKKPDFAYPKTVATNAEADLKKAMANDDAHAALNALIRLYLANTLIDDSKAQASIKRVEEVAQHFEASPLQGVYKALLAKMYTTAYSSDSWTYNLRELPLTPIPADITEWSGEQYKAKIAELMRQSWAGGKESPLAKLKVVDYADIIEADRTSKIFYPTLLDFVYACAYNILESELRSSFPISTAEICDMAIENASVEAAKIAWTNTSLKSADFNKAREAYEKYQGDEYSAMLLCSAIRKIGSASVDDLDWIFDDEDEIEAVEETLSENKVVLAKKKWAINAIDYLLASYPNSIFKPNLQSARQELTQPKFEISYNKTAFLGHPLSISATIKNASKVRLQVYKVNASYIKYSSVNGKILKQLIPVEVIEFDMTDAVPFEVERTHEITLQAEGYYAIVPLLYNHKINENENFRVLRCVSTVPMFANLDSKKQWLLAVDGFTGKPVPDVNAYLIPDEKPKINLGKTDSLGSVPITTTAPSKYSYWRVCAALELNGKIEKFEDVLQYLNTKNENVSTTNVVGSVLTDRALYHPGDVIHALAVISETKTDEDNNFTQKCLADFSIKAQLRNVNNQVVKEITAQTDDFGRAALDFTTPTDGLTGYYSINIIEEGNDRSITSKSVMVSDYRMPDFELTIDSTERDVPSQGCVTIKGSAKTYSGMPLAGVQVDVQLSTASWWRWLQPQSPFFSTSIETDNDGNFSIVFKPEDFAKSGNSNINLYIAQFDASSSSGTTATASAPFSLGKQYMISIEAPGCVNALSPFKPEAKAYDCNGTAVDIPLCWEILGDGKKLIASGEMSGAIDLSAITPGQYILKVSAVDGALADSSECNFSIYNTSTDIIPTSSPLWALQSAIERQGNKAKILLGTAADEAYVYSVVCTSANVGELQLLTIKKGYQEVEIELPSTGGEINVYFFTMRDGEICSHRATVKQPAASALKITGESFRNKLVPTAHETWKFSIAYSDGTPAESALVLDMYNKALEAIASHSLDIRVIRPNYWFSANITSVSTSNNLKSVYGPLKPFKTIGISMPSFNFYGMLARGVMLRGVGSSNRMMKASYAQENLMCTDAVITSEVAEECESVAICDTAEAAGADVPPANPEGEAFEYRDADVPLAIWAPVLTTDDKGNIVYSFTVPNANTTWRLRAVAWTKGLDTAELMHDFVASKPVMVAPNAPRFLRQGDSAVITALVMNKTDEAAKITTTIEVFDPISGDIINTKTFANNLDANSSATVAIPVEATASMQAIGVRVKASNGQFADGEQLAFPVLPSMASLVETFPFYLNPADTHYSTTLPKGRDARISLTFSENPAWSIVSALPGLREDAGLTANSAAAAIFSAAISRGIIAENPAIAEAIKQWLANPTDSALVSMLEKNQDLKIALLNSTPWVQAAQSQTERMARLAMIFDKKQVDSSIAAAIKALTDLQKPDGGYGWGKWSKESSEWTTANVLSMVADLHTIGWMPTDKTLNASIGKAVAYWDACQAKRLRDAKEKDQVTDIIYTVLRKQLPDNPTADGERVIANTTRSILKDWKSLSVDIKAMAAVALHRNGYASMARELMRSVSEFGVWTPAQGLTFPSVTSLASYATILEAYAVVEPKAKEVDGIRQQLIIRKQANDWGSAVVTTQVVAGILSSGTVWTVPAQGASITAGGHAIKPQDAMETSTGNIRADLSAYAGKKLEIATPGVGPAYGAVYAQFKQQMADVKALGCDDLTIEKGLAVSRGTGWEAASEASLKVGDRVKVTLTIHAKRPMSYMAIVDDRPAAFSPVAQLPGWMWAEGVGFYRENRDACTNIFVDYMPAGTYILTYEMNVTVAGTFSSGVASIQSQQAPELSAHSSGSVIKIAPKAE